MLNALANVLHAEGEIVHIVRAKKVWNSVISDDAITRGHGSMLTQPRSLPRGEQTLMVLNHDSSVKAR